MLDWLLDPTHLSALVSLIILEVVLGIDNLVFIAVLADKLPAKQRDKARILGLTLAMVMRLLLLSIVSHLAVLKDEWFSLYGHSFSKRDVILLVGGFFLIFKATMELHEKLDAAPAHLEKKRIKSSFTAVVLQIVILDAVFSIDSIITAIGMTEGLSGQLLVTMLAVVVSMAIMLLASKPLTRFVNAHRSVVVLCLSFLLMIGFSLIAGGLGIDVPKEYLYSAIGFSILIEALNQIAHRNDIKLYSEIPLRVRTANAVLGLLGDKKASQEEDDDENEVSAAEKERSDTFHKAERNMVSGVLTLAERTVESIMTPRTDIDWLDSELSIPEIIAFLRQTSASRVPVCRGELDEVQGIVRTQVLMDLLLSQKVVDWQQAIKQPVIVPENIGTLRLIETLQKSGGEMALVVDEFGSIIGLVTPMDIFEAIAGDFPDENESPDIQKTAENSWIVSGSADLHHLEQELHVNFLVDDDREYATVAGYLLEQIGHLPQPGETLFAEPLYFEILEVQQRRIARVQITRSPSPTEEE